MPTQVQLSTVGQPLIQGNHKLHIIVVLYLHRATHSEAKHCIFYITYIHICVFGGGDIHAIFQTFVYTLSFLVPQLSYRGSTILLSLYIRNTTRAIYFVSVELATLIGSGVQFMLCVHSTQHINRSIRRYLLLMQQSIGGA